LICSVELGNRHQTPTLIGCMFLRNLASNSALRFLLLPAFAAISEALNYRSFLEDLSTSMVSADSLRCRFALAIRLRCFVSGALNSIPVFFCWSTQVSSTLSAFRGRLAFALRCRVQQSLRL
jgi:hypothetical protein